MTWKTVSEIAKSGQGTTFLVENQEGRGVMKVLKKTNSLEARRRMYQEVTNLEIVKNSGASVPSVLDRCNIMDWDKGYNNLQFVMEFIDGRTLDDVVKEGLSPSQSIRIVLELCEILRISHKEGICHRDIKPKNIIITKTIDPATPPVTVLLDFGLSFSTDLDIDLTETGEKIGNRFFALPENQGDNQRDYRSDITYLSAILLYCLTKEEPRSLVGVKKPHEIHYSKWKEKFEGVALSGMKSLFERAFQLDINYRFQTIFELSERLKAIISKDEAPISSIIEITQRLYQKDRNVFLKKHYSRMHDPFHQLMSKIFTSIPLTETPFNLSSGGWGTDNQSIKIAPCLLHSEKLGITTQYNISIKGNDHFCCLKVSINVVGYECIISFRQIIVIKCLGEPRHKILDDFEIDIYRFPLDGEIEADIFQKILTSKCIKSMEMLVEIIPTSILKDIP